MRQDRDLAALVRKAAILIVCLVASVAAFWWIVP
jgi:hypothetical protein